MSDPAKTPPAPPPLPQRKPAKTVEQMLAEPVLRVSSIAGQLATTPLTPAQHALRPCLWKLLLNYLSADVSLWESTVATLSGQYQQFLDDFYFNFRFRKTDILALLQKDLPRMFPSIPFYQSVPHAAG